MSDTSLPENLDDWPDDPFVLFGVSHDVSSRDLKRAYTRLIREFKPERMPAHFQRIRAAYEVLQKFAVWNEANSVEHPSTPELEPLHPPRSVPESSELPRDLQVGSASPDLSHASIVEEAWRWAVNGKHEQAYRELQNILEQHPRQATLYQRLYWLLIAYPEFDTQKSPRSWLYAGILTCTPNAQLVELLSEELLDEPALSLGADFETLLNQASGLLLCELLEQRWQALARLARWDVCRGDLGFFQERVCQDDEVAWLRLLVSMAGKSFRDNAYSFDSTIRFCESQIKALEHLSLGHGELFDRAELLIEISREAIINLPWIAINEQSRSTGSKDLVREATGGRWTILDVLTPFLAGRMDDASAALEPILALVNQRPREGLRLLDQCAAAAPALFLEFGRALDVLTWSESKREELNHDDAATRHLAERLLDELDEDNYPALRPDILRFCCEQAIAPDQVCESFERPDAGSFRLLQQIGGDLALRWTYRVYRLSWSM